MSRFTRHFLLTKPSVRALKLARQSWLGLVQCHYPDNLNLPLNKMFFAMRLFRQPLQFPAGSNIYQLARDYAEAVLDEIDQLLPGFFQVGDWDFRFVFRFNLQFYLAYQGLPLLYSALLESYSRQGPVTLVDSHLSPKLMCRFVKQTGAEQLRIEPRCLSTLNSTRLSRKLAQWVEQALPKLEEPCWGGTLAVIPHAEHWELLAPFLEVLGEQGVIRVLGLNSKVSIPKNELPNGTIHTLSGLCIGPNLEKAITHLEKLNNDIQHLSKVQQQFCYIQIDLLSDLIEKFLAFEATIERLRPDTIIGCLEFNLYGAFLSMLRQQSGKFRLMNVQHGIVSPTWTVDGLYFDDYFMWNQQTAEALQQNGYSVTNSLHVIGNPKWETLARQFASAPTSRHYDELMLWKGSSPLIGAYTQSLQGYSTAQIKRNYLSSLIGYLQHNPNAKLLVKRHPLETDDILYLLVKDSGCEERIYICESKALPLWETLKAVDVVTSVFSATLYEGLYLQKNTLALDFERVIAIQQVPWPEDLVTVTDPLLVNDTLDFWLSLPHNEHLSGHNKKWDSIVPHFDTNYTQRFRKWVDQSADALLISSG